MNTPDYFQVDVFASTSLNGNGLSVFPQAEHWDAERMQAITREMRQFESIFLMHANPNGAEARIFTVEEELPFAGHPLLGAAAVLHRIFKADEPQASWQIRLQERSVEVFSTQLEKQRQTKLDEKRSTYYSCTMNQGKPQIGPVLARSSLSKVLRSLSLYETDLVTELPARVISTGLDYLILPVTPAALERTKICSTSLESELTELGAKFVFVVDITNKEIRTWDNLGQVEDVATGSAIGPALAYLVHQGLANISERITWRQGRFVHRPSKLLTWMDQQNQVWVSGEVWPFATGSIDAEI
ncbi:PhzF family phenazine biosynthesis protein [Undibacterium cyanobacteriorum]|uniref:PhzF family phenazine biosynthesis protein n=1 Tax=Undibacterium cyanobacteriorum TaxID=3073561 RepID=A0ABY9RIH2_9BURK|nr:PhzF family phenazine biosynthesis protein [Undibacterium sp. 20NA77.5]WMW81014.1 PhzF family phenazine biosynthesis protein [Undibacterium sp. 20NA77.5]